MIEKDIDIVVLIPTYNRIELLDRTLSSLSECNLPDNYKETIVIENGGRFGAESIVKNYEKILSAKYLYVEEGNKSNALNEAIKGLDNCLLFFTDDDVRFDKNILIEYSKAAKGFESGRLYGGPFGVDYESGPPPEWLLKLLPLSLRGHCLFNEVHAVDKPIFSGLNWAAFKKDIDSVGGFSPQFGPGSKMGSAGQETYTMKRLLENHIQAFYLPKAMIWHFAPEKDCNVEYSERYFYRVNIFHGYNSPNRKTLFGIPVDLIKRWFKVKVYLIITAIFRIRRKNYSARIEMKRVKGLIHGYKLNSIRNG